MNTPNISPGADPDPHIDLTDQVVDITGRTLQVSDRVQRLRGTSEQASWGTLTARFDDGETTSWLVIDNLGRTHRDIEADLCRAVRGQAKSYGTNP
jgi:hypothetical protein